MAKLAFLLKILFRRTPLCKRDETFEFLFMLTSSGHEQLCSVFKFSLSDKELNIA